MSRVIHFELPADDPERAIAFYEQAFGWNFEKWTGAATGNSPQTHATMTGEKPNCSLYPFVGIGQTKIEQPPSDCSHRQPKFFRVILVKAVRNYRRYH